MAGATVLGGLAVFLLVAGPRVDCLEAPEASVSGSATAMAISPLLSNQGLIKAGEQSVAVLEAIRGARHKGYSCITFQFSHEVGFEDPDVNKDRAVFHLRNVKTYLAPFKEYRAFDSSATLIKRGKGLDVSIKLPEDLDRIKSFLLESPCRLVVWLYHSKSNEEDS